jgi:hypothetical protein
VVAALADSPETPLLDDAAPDVATAEPQLRIVAMASMRTLIGAKFRPPIVTDAVASVVTALVLTRPRALAVPVVASELAPPTAAPGPAPPHAAPAQAVPGLAPPHAAPAQAAPEVDEPVPPAVTETLCVCVRLIGAWVVDPPGATRLA